MLTEYSDQMTRKLSPAIPSIDSWLLTTLLLLILVAACSSTPEPNADATPTAIVTTPTATAFTPISATVQAPSATPTPLPTLEPWDRVGFRNVAAAAGLDFQHGAFRWAMSGDPVAMMGGGLCWIDYDQDGWLDLFVVNSYAELEAGQWQAGGGLPTSALYHNTGGRFEDVSQASGAALPLRGNGCVAADLNRDDWPDVYITTERFNALLWNNGDGTFTEGAEAAGVDAYGWQTAAAVGDLNDDHWPDLFVAGYVDLNNRIEGATLGFPNTHLGRRDLLFVNQGPDALGHTTFSEVGEEVGLETADSGAGRFEYGLGALLSDLDRDGDLDLYVANDTNPNRLYENVPWPGDGADDPIGFRFREVGVPAHVDDSNSGMGVASGDYDNDGRFDLFVTNLGDQLHAVHLNQSRDGELFFDDTTETFGVPALDIGFTGWGVSWADFDHDTDLDLFVTNGRVPVLDLGADGQVPQIYGNLAIQAQPGRFQDLTAALGLEEVGPLIGRGSAVADYDNDGDLDVAVATIGGPLVLLQNNLAAGNWLEVQLTGFHPGAVVTLELPGGRELRRELLAGSSYLSSEDPRLHFGLGAASSISGMRVDWPDGHVTRIGVLPANQLVIVRP